MMTSSEIRQSFLDFFKSKKHTIVSSSSLLPDSPNLLFTNAGMNQFVPIFLGQNKPQWSPPRVADTQKCIRAGGKHNDLEDVGLDTYHHTFFEMLGNWSFGDYFKKEAIEWAWELLVNVWKFPKERLYATYFGGDEKTPADNEARDLWLRYLPADQVIAGNRKDNFWMMGDTGPCGPCSEIHMDLTPAGHGGAKLVNAGSPQCIEIWNLVFIQFNANPDGSLTPLSAKHVDTGMGFERVCGIMQCTNGLKDFSGTISNYESDAFTPIFRELEKLSGKKYTSTLPQDSKTPSPQHSIDIAFRVIADHIRCLSFAMADGILPSNEGRGYVLRRILRRAVRYGRNLGFHEPFFYKLVGVVADNFSGVFPEVRKRREKIESVLKAEEESFNRTLDNGIQVFDRMHFEALAALAPEDFNLPEYDEVWISVPDTRLLHEKKLVRTRPLPEDLKARTFVWAIGQIGSQTRDRVLKKTPTISGANAFELYDTYGFPLDLTELMARERGLTVDVAGFEKLMDEQRQRAREDHEKKKTVVSAVVQNAEVIPTKFIGYNSLEVEAIVEVVSSTGENAFEIALDRTPFYAEMGGQVGDAGLIGSFRIVDTQRLGVVYVHKTEAADKLPAPLQIGQRVRAAVDVPRRMNIQRHHTVTHLFHWALHEVVSRDARQRGSLVAPDRLRFDFNHGERLTEQQIADVEKLVNDRIKENAPVFWFEMQYAEVRGNPNVMQFFGDKYGDVVRIVQIGGRDKALDGFSMELCGGTHTKTTSEIKLFKIAKESAIAAGIRRVEAVCGQFATEFLERSKVEEAGEAAKARAREQEKELAKQRQSETQSRAPAIAEQLLTKLQGKLLVSNLGEANAELLRAVVDALKPKLTSAVVVLGGAVEGKVALICYVTPDLVKQGKHAGKIVGELAKICGGGGGGKPDLAQAGGKQPEKLTEALAEVPRIVSL
jgi:alanyl-tRNA synthetase